MPAWACGVDPPQRDVGELAGLERPDLVVPAEHPRAAHRGQLEAVAHGQRLRSADARGRTAPRAGAPRPARPPRWTRHRRRRARPAPRPSRRSRVRQMPAPSRALDDGQWATPVRVAANVAMSESSRWTPWASQTSGPSQPSDSTYSTGPQPNFSRQKSSSSTVSARCVCSRTPLSRASTAALLEQVCGHRERRARGDADPQHRVGGGVVVPVDRVGGRGEDLVEVLHDVVGRQTTLARLRGPSTRGSAGSAARPPGPPRSRRRAGRRRPRGRRSDGRSSSCNPSAPAVRARRSPRCVPRPRRGTPTPGRAWSAIRRACGRRPRPGSATGTGGGAC